MNKTIKILIPIFIIVLTVVAGLLIWTNYKEKNDNSVNDELAQSLYDKYIKYTDYETNNYKNINANDSTSNEYLVKYAIYKVLEDNKINIDNYSFNNEDFNNSSSYKNGYKISVDLINKYIKDNFNIQRNIDFKNLKLEFVSNSNIDYRYDEREKAYTLVASSSIPKTGASDSIVYSKYNGFKVVDDELIIYTDFFLIGQDFEHYYIHNSMDNINVVENFIGDSKTKVDVDYVLKNHNSKVGKFEHKFKKINDNYYWVSTNKTN